MTIKNINRVKRRSHLDNRFIGEETKVFEGLQSLWIAKPGKMFYFNNGFKSLELPNISMKFSSFVRTGFIFCG